MKKVEEWKGENPRMLLYEGAIESAEMSANIVPCDFDWASINETGRILLLGSGNSNRLTLGYKPLKAFLGYTNT